MISKKIPLLKRIRNRLGEKLSDFLLADADGLTSDGKRIAHFHIQKCGGSSINHAFYSLVYTSDVLDLAKRKKLIDDAEKINPSMRGNLAYRVFNRSSNKIMKNGCFSVTRSAHLFRSLKASFIHGHNLPLDLLDRQDTFSFTVLRDPVSRLISRYYMDYGLSKKPGGLAHYSREEYHGIIEDPRQYFKTLQRLSPLSYYGILGTFSPKLNLEEAKRNLNKIDAILLQSNLDEDFINMVQENQISIFGYSQRLNRAKDSNRIPHNLPEITDDFKNELHETLSDEYTLIYST